MEPAAKAAAGTAQRVFKEIHGVVVSAGKMDRTVKVRVAGRRWNSFIKKHFDDPKTHLVHDPNNSLRLGDIVAITPGWRTSQSKRHVIKHIIAPGSGVPIEDRPEIPTELERTAKRETERALKDTRRMVRQLEARVDQRLAATGKLVKKTEHAMRLGAGILGVAWPGDENARKHGKRRG
ncbi:uncharacterized protein C8A04DRAFT_40183 [Dichotomopilus funicola]|uniref:Uncharacterized protein n=1 Tax=Dichotomopilus funicola TaxID=1934379 RepID=A0AAN6ZJQ0_9PEZI|nr:hypothetical protein C8A04DRAFT_40183 [Dichotomopilus funicola]